MENEKTSKKLKTSSSSSSSDIVSDLNLPSDLLPEVLAKLPIKSLCRFKCVSKYVKCLIENPVFIDNIRPKNTSINWAIDDGKDILIYSLDENGSLLKPVQLIRFESYLYDTRYCNGLVCYDNDNDFCLCNLTTQELIKVKCDFTHIEFGFDPLSMKYKVLGWNRDFNACISDCCVFTLEKNSSWRQLRQVRSISPIKWLGESEVTANGAVFWFNHGEEGTRIISFNFATENFGIIKLPNMMSNKEEGLMSTLFEFEGCLCLVEQRKCTLDRCHLEIVNLWMLKDNDNNIWVSIVKNTILPMEGTCLREQFLGLLPMDIKEAQFAGRNGEIMITTSDNKTVYIFLYSPLNGQLKRIKASGLPFLEVTWKPYVENHLSFQEFISHDA
ncbi:F-box and associated interaction domains-containing protein [Thalictrum thalictroides]|uniref:F-box and associated interaction domains-containing protein n=1 Tax=Thalictrum thalictroides TaxID=46969 RepID=A0A7J6V3S2_THATH|nr:F-box and associated interaction domains-containing protein [Thalictrum thalictroides]